MKIDLHIHTKFSWDGFSTPKEVVDAAVEKGIDCICIADHNQIDGASQAMKYAFDKNILVFGANYAVPPAIILDYRPDYIVLMEDFVHNGLARNSKFNELYAQVEFIPTDYYGTGMILYQRRDLSDSPTQASQKPN